MVVERRKQGECSDMVPASFSAPPPDAVWHQVNIGLVRLNGDAVPSARATFQAVAPLLDCWSSEGRLHWWFFMRKPPDLRLRVYLRPDGSHDLKNLDAALWTLSDPKRIRGHYWNRYLAEQGRFGGVAAMSLAHSYFHVDSHLWLYLDQLESRGLRTLEPDQLLPAVLHHLFVCCCGPEEAATAWCRLAGLIGDLMPSDTPNDPVMPAGLDVLAGATKLSTGERSALRAYAQSNRLLGQGFRHLAAETKLEHPISLIVATIALFNLNRHGFTGERSGRMMRPILVAIGHRSEFVPY